MTPNADPRYTTVYLALGSNLGDRRINMIRAAELLEGDGIALQAASRLYETEPVGGPPNQGDFLNAALKAQTTLTPDRLLARTRSVESHLHRVRSERNAPRTIDVDILLLGSQIIESASLTIPHPRMHLRAFVLAPLAEIDPDVAHPVFKRTIQALLTDVERNSSLRVEPATAQWDLPDKLAGAGQARD